MLRVQRIRLNSGNCGYNQAKDQYLRCKPSDVACGRLQCQHESERPVFGDPSTVYAAYNFVRDAAGRDVQCRVVRTTMTGVGKKQAADPGMVPNGARCGQDNICVDAQCRNASEVLQMVSKCQPENCNGKGICNNMGNCHCIAGYGGIACDLPGPGGSVNSGPAGGRVFNPGLALLYVLVVTVVLFLLATIYCRRKRGFWLHKKIWYKVRVALELRSFRLEPTRKAPPPPGSTILHTHRHSLNAVWGDDTAVVGSPRGEVLCVDATRPYMMGGARAVLKVTEVRDQNHEVPQQLLANFMASPTNVQYFNNATAFPNATKPAKKSSASKVASERRALVAPPGYDTGGSTSSDEPDQKARHQHNVSTTPKATAAAQPGPYHHYDQTPPAPPPHKNKLNHPSTADDNQHQRVHAVQQPKLPLKSPVIKENDDGGGRDGDAKINVKALAAKFEKK